MKKLSAVYDGDMILKYQLISEDLDSLVSVRNNEDLRHMLEEYDRHENEGSPKFRAFLFPSEPIIMENQPLPVDPQAVEQRYIDAINGLVRSASCNGRLTPIKARYSSYSISSACSSPKSTSPDKAVNSNPNDILAINGGFSNGRSSMHKVQSSPSISSLNTIHPQSNSTSPCNHHLYQLPSPLHHANQHQLHHPHSYQSSIPPPELVRGQMGLSPTHYYATGRNHLGAIGYNKYRHYDEPGYRRFDTQSLPQSPKVGSFDDMKGLRWNSGVDSDQEDENTV